MNKCSIDKHMILFPSYNNVHMEHFHYPVLFLFLTHKNYIYSNKYYCTNNEYYNK